MTKQQITKIVIEQGQISETQSATFCEVTRLGWTIRRFRISEASKRRAAKAAWCSKRQTSGYIRNGQIVMKLSATEAF